MIKLFDWVRKFFKWALSKKGKTFFSILNKFIIAAASIATVVVVILTKQTLNEIQKQRIIANQPELVINSEIPFGMLTKIEFDVDTFDRITTYTYNNKIDTNHIKIKFSNQWYILRFDWLNDFEFPIANIGLGMAKDIKLDWYFDTLKIMHYYNDTFKTFRPIQKMIKGDGRVSFISHNDTIYQKEWDRRDFVKYILPSSDNNNILYLKIPEIYLQLWSFLEICKYLHYDFIEYSLRKKEDICPPLFLHISYNDINQMTYNKQYKVVVKSSFMSLGTDLHLTMSNSRILFDEIEYEDDK
jgi:hypothetical protein